MVEEMYGLCDGKSIIFKYVGEGLWETIVPADMDDGKYIVEIYARLFTGDIIYYAAVLYICDSRFVSLTPIEDGNYVIISENRMYASVSELVHEELCKDGLVAVVLPPSISEKVSVTAYEC